MSDHPDNSLQFYAHFRDAHTGSDRCLHFSPDGTKLAIGCGDGRVEILDARTREPILPRPPGCTAVAVGPAGRLLAAGDESGRVTLYDLATLEAVRTWPASEKRIEALAFSPDRRLLATAALTERVQIWDVESGTLRRELNTPSGANALEFTSDGTRLVGCVRGSFPYVWNTLTGLPVHVLHQGGYATRDLAISPDGRTLFSWSNGRPSAFRSFDLETGPGTVFELSEHTTVSNVTGPRISPDGRLLAISWQNRVDLWAIETIQAHPAQRAGMNPWQQFRVGHLNRLTFSPDGHSLATAGTSGELRLWNVTPDAPGESAPHPAAPQATLQLGPPMGNIRDVHYTPDGRHLVTLNGNGTVYVLRLSPRT